MEAKSSDLLAEKQAKAALEKKILGMQSSMLIGGHQRGSGGGPELKSLLAAEQRRIKREYEQRLRDLEREREGDL